MGKEKANQQVTFGNIVNIFKKNILLIVFILLCSLLSGLVYNSVVKRDYSSAANITSTKAIDANSGQQMTLMLNSENFIVDLIAHLEEKEIPTLNGGIEEFKSGLAGGIADDKALIYRITLTTKQTDVLVPILSQTTHYFIEYVKANPTLADLGTKLSFTSTPDAPSIIGTSKTTIYLIATVFGVLLSAIIILTKELISGVVFDKKDLATSNFINLKLPRANKFKARDFLRWPAIPNDLEKALHEHRNKDALIKAQNEVIAKVGFDKNVQIFYSTTKEPLHGMFIETYLKSFSDSGKRAILINLDDAMKIGKNSLSLKQCMDNNKIVLFEKQTGTVSPTILDNKCLTYSALVINNSAFLKYLNTLKANYDYVLINAGLKIDELNGILAKINTPIVCVYSNHTKKNTYNNYLDKLSDDALTILVS